MSVSNKIELTSADLESHLSEQLQFLQASAAAFDVGFDGEAKRLAVALRILLHDAKSSKSLLGQLGRKGGPFFDTALENVPNNMVPYLGLLSMILKTGSGASYRAPLDDREGRETTFPDWWERAIFVDNQGREISRREVVLTAADQDGGAHVDPAIDAKYAALARGSSLGWVSTSKEERTVMEGAERAAIRQITHEIFKSLVPDYRRVPDHTAVSGVVVEGV